LPQKIALQEHCTSCCAGALLKVTRNLRRVLA
jgi:hypothetical protein